MPSPHPLLSRLCCFAGLLAALPVAVAIVGRPAAAGEEGSLKPSAADLEFFEKQVRPLLVERCYECHSGKADEPKGGLRVDSRASLLTGGDTGPAVVPGDPQKSLLIDAVNYGDLYQMPPKSKLPGKEIAALTRWVELGAPWPQDDAAATATAAPRNENEFDLARRRASHWCWRPIVRRSPPAVRDTAWPRDAIDRFVLARLEREGLAPAAEADRATLLRRVTFDLTGLPPTRAEVEAFLADDSPTAYERVVDRLLASPRFGERWGRHWLDLVRYAESRGHEFDFNIPNVWHYRDYVIRALNADVPFDQFVVEHVAGDLLPRPRLNPTEGFNESVLGTGFWFLGEWVHSPVDIRQDEADRFDNMVDVFGKTFLGLTIGCARCHDHKFDAISQADYYALTGYLQSTDYRQVRFDSDVHNRRIAAQLARLDRETAPQLAPLVARRYTGVVAKLDSYLLAAREVLVSGAVQGSPAEKEQLARLAGQYGVDAQRLAAWTAHLRSPRSTADDPFRDFTRLALSATDGAAPLRQPVDELKAAWASELARRAQRRSELELIVDFATLRDADWMPDGPTFGAGPVRPGDLRLSTDADSAIADVAAYGAARRDPLWNDLRLPPGVENDPGGLGRWQTSGRTMRTPTFEIRRDNVYYLVRGKGHAFAVVDSHRMIKGPLHGSLLKDFDTGGRLAWIGHNVARYRGHAAHVEFAAEGDEPLEVLMVAQADSPPGEVADGPNRLLLAELEEAQQKTISDVAHAWQQAFAKAYLALERSELGALAAPADAARLIRWMLQQPELFRSNDEAVERQIQQLVAAYCDRRQALVQDIRWTSRTAPAMWDGEAENEHLLIRGNPKAAGPPVQRGLPEALCGERRDLGVAGSGRRDLARRLIDPSNPLVSRVIVNRLWHHLFGRGLCASVDNFGVLGAPPTHGELLDYLAAEFMADGWSQKRMIRRLVLSSTYRMASTHGLDADNKDAGNKRDAVDPQNLLLHRQNVRRLEAEAIRDTLLALSGRLDNRMYGKSVNVYLTPFMQGRGRPPQGPLDGDGRRSIYISIRRNFLAPMMLAFDAPQPFNTVGRRNVSNVPAQALTMMNDPLVVEQAKLWALRELDDANAGPTERITNIYRAAFARDPDPQELEAARIFITTQGQEYGLRPEHSATDERVWADLCHVLMNAKEFILIN